MSGLMLIFLYLLIAIISESPEYQTYEIADNVNGMVVQRDRTGRLPQLQDLPYTTAAPTNVAPFNVPTTAVYPSAVTNPQVGNVSQQLPQCWELAQSLHLLERSL